MATVEETVNAIISTGSWDERVAQMRLVAQRHGTAEHTRIYAEVANQVYVPHLAPDLAYVHSMDFYELSTFQASYRATLEATQGFTDMSQETVTRALLDQPRSLLTFRTVLGLLTKELASATTLVSSSSSPRRVSPGVIEGMERHGTRPSEDTAMTLALTIVKAMDGTLFGDPPDGLRTKQDKFDTRDGWATAAALARDGGTARDKAHRFERLRAESVRLGGVPLVGVLAGLGWARVNDTLGPVIRDTDGRVFTLSNLTQMLTVSPFPQLIGAAPA
ncbi:hypothetical protein D4740_08985 [Actinomyces sp. 2119]|uniref:hypothetical protein n=1 Tax=Actinomyces sp. 2119 TaxID=2321393 RepID=UPI000E6BE852|nr:hypothetical protein [Actinomyces sp. 2119]RJF41513.1 hypothetical protein D4740_08985 [Actinomyces sp. 2119]